MLRHHLRMYWLTVTSEADDGLVPIRFSVVVLIVFFPCFCCAVCCAPPLDHRIDCVPRRIVMVCELNVLSFVRHCPAFRSHHISRNKLKRWVSSVLFYFVCFVVCRSFPPLCHTQSAWGIVCEHSRRLIISLKFIWKRAGCLFATSSWDRFVCIFRLYCVEQWRIRRRHWLSARVQIITKH